MTNNLDNVSTELLRSIEQMGQKRTKQPQPAQTVPPTRYDFVRLGAEIARATVEAAEGQVRQAEILAEETRGHAAKLAAAMVRALTEAAEMRVDQARRILEEAHAFSADLRSQVENKDRELAEMGGRLEAFGMTLRDAHLKFCTDIMPIPTQGGHEMEALDLKEPEGH